jgi:hypothetical protein
MMDKVPAPGWLVIGWLTGMGLKYLWEVLRLPGYGIKLFNLPATSHPNTIGADDLALWLIGVLIIVANRKDRFTVLFGVGFIAGLLTSKLFEVYDTTPAGIITPASFALLPPPT